MTTGRINQVANPLFVTASWPLLGGQPAAELQRSAVPGWGNGQTGLGGMVRSFPSPATAAFRWWCWGREVPSHTPRACGFLRAYWALSEQGLSVRLGPGLVVLGRTTGRPTHWASSSLLVESVR